MIATTGVPSDPLPRFHTRLAKRFGSETAFTSALFHPVGLALAACVRVVAGTLRLPGLSAHDRITRIASRLIRARPNDFQPRLLSIWPLDTVRYFEFDRFLDRIDQAGPFPRVLDVSSPRLLLALALEDRQFGSLDVLNPDRADLNETRNLLDDCGLGANCSYFPVTADELGPAEGGYDLITSMSVLEHIPGDGDRRTVRSLWSRLRSGGRLLLSFPCAAAAFEEYVDFDPYGLYPATAGGFYFAQRFYDRRLVTERILSVTGPPDGEWYYGEKRPGVYFALRRNRARWPAYYHYSLEPLRMALGFRRFATVEQLPGVGVGCFEWVKR